MDAMFCVKWDGHFTLAIIMISEGTILFLQSAAATFMSADYFFTEKQREPINAVIQRVLTPMNLQVTADAQRHIQSATENAASLIVSVLFLAGGWLGVTFLLPAIGSIAGPWVVGIAALLFVGLFFWWVAHIPNSNCCLPNPSHYGEVNGACTEVPNPLP